MFLREENEKVHGGKPSRWSWVLFREYWMVKMKSLEAYLPGGLGVVDVVNDVLRLRWL